MKRNNESHSGHLIFRCSGKIVLRMKLTIVFVLLGIIQSVALDNFPDQLVEGADVNYQVSDRHVVLSTIQLGQQARTISGRVTDASGAPLPGVTILIKGTTQ